MTQGPVEGAQAVWDGTGWIIPGTSFRWDGTAWVDTAAQHPAAPPSPAAPAAVPVVGAGTVFVQVLWRAWLVCAVGAGLVGLVATVAVAVASRELAGIGFAFVVGLVGALVGAVLGIVAAPIMGGVCAWRLVPYRGRAACLWPARVTAMVIVALFLGLFFSGAVLDDATSVVYLVLLVVASLVGAWFGGGWTVRWYLRRMEAGSTG